MAGGYRSWLVVSAVAAVAGLWACTSTTKSTSRDHDNSGDGGSAGAVDSDVGSGGSTATSRGGTGGSGGDATGEAGSGGETTGGGGGSGGGSGGGATGGAGTGGTGPAACDEDFECDGATLSSCVAGVTSEVEACVDVALCDADAGKCIPPACEDAEQRCVGTSLERCKANRTGFDVVDECVSAALCSPGADACTLPACEANEYQCSGSILQACAEDQTGFVDALDCTDADLCDNENGSCEAICNPNDYQCNAGVLLRCSSGGTVLEFVETCATAALCNATGGRCETPACALNEHDCDGNALLVCNSDRDDFVQTDICDTAALCDADGGKCDPPVCDVGEYQCQGNVLRICNSGRTGFTTSESCASDEICNVSPPGCQPSTAIVGGLDGQLYEIPCGDTPSTDDCSAGGYRINGEASSCQGNALDGNAYYDVGGISGAVYDATLHFYGVVEPKNYGNGVTRDAGNGRPDLNGGTPDSWGEAAGGHAYPGSNYNTYEVRIEDENGQEVAAYYLNSDTQEGHYTMLVNYEKTIPVIGGGRVHFRSFDANCRIIKNCGSSGGFPCAAKARVINIGAAVPQPSNFDQPDLGVGNADHSGQWLLIDVLSVVAQ